MEMFRGFEAAKSFEPKKVAAALMANNGQFTSVKGPARWREDHSAILQVRGFLVRGKGAERKRRLGPVQSGGIPGRRFGDAYSEVLGY